jgi:hypothetical protein
VACGLFPPWQILCVSIDDPGGKIVAAGVVTRRHLGSWGASFGTKTKETGQFSRKIAEFEV